VPARRGCGHSPWLNTSLCRPGRKERRSGGLAVGRARDANADRHRPRWDEAPVNLFDRLAKTLADRRCFARGETGQDDRNLFATITINETPAAHSTAEYFRHATQHPIACGMPTVLVVDLLEVVDVEK
jgi:hypothetical protein